MSDTKPETRSSENSKQDKCRKQNTTPRHGKYKLQKIKNKEKSWKPEWGKIILMEEQK